MSQVVVIHPVGVKRRKANTLLSEKLSLGEFSLGSISFIQNSIVFFGIKIN